MGYFHRAAAGCVMASLCLSVFAAENPKAKRQLKIDYSKAQRVEVTDQMRANFPKSIEGRRALLAKNVPPCQYQPGGVCAFNIPVILVPDPADPANIYCVAVFPEVLSLPGA